MADELHPDQPIRWGILSAGGIATTVSADIARTDGNVVGAVAARSLDRAQTLADQHPGARAYGDYAELVADPDLDVIYIGTTHPGHHDQALMCLAGGKPVLIEKPVCLNAADATEVFDAAKRADLFAMEAMWMRTNPLIRQAEQLINDGAIGEVVAVRASLSLGRPYDPTHRIYDRDNGGGALLDFGIYPVTFAWLFLGQPDEVRVDGTLAPSGVDETVAMQWFYAHGQDAQLWCSAPYVGPSRGTIIGSTGWIETIGRFHHPSALVVHRGDTEDVISAPASDGRGYEPEIAEVARCLRGGLIESPLIPHADTIAILALLDQARAHLGVTYPGE